MCDELFDLLRIKSISTHSDYKEDVQQCAEHVLRHLKNIGLENTRIFQTKGHPLVFSEYHVSKDAPTVLIYGHYDVQPPDPYDLWKSDPFNPEIRNGYIYARGVSDDKGQFFCHIKSIEALLKKDNTLPVNIKLLIEGEEEIGSPNLPNFIEEHQALLKSDVALISDTPMVSKDQPALCFALRGMVYLEIHVQGPNKDLHSGQYGGIVRNPIHALSHIINKLKTEDEIIQIPGFYDDVYPISEDNKNSFNEFPYTENDFRKELNVKTLSYPKGKSIAECLWLYPTLDCNGIVGGYIDEGAKTIIPSHASTKISMRLVANQNPEIISKSAIEYIKKCCPEGVTVTVDVHNLAYPARMNSSSSFMKAAENAFYTVYKKKPLLIGEGGTIPVVADFKRLLEIDTVMMGFNCPDDCIHSPNERFAVDAFYNGIETSYRFLKNLND